MIQRLILASLMACAWMALTARFALDAFVVGLLLGVAILRLTQESTTKIDPTKLPDQAAALLVYCLRLCRDIWLSAIDVAKKIVQPKLKLNSGIIAVPTQDETKDANIAALSAHAITITPGELVVDFDGAEVMYVHCLDTEASSKTADAAQAARLKLLRRVLR